MHEEAPKKTNREKMTQAEKKLKQNNGTRMSTFFPLLFKNKLVVSEKLPQKVNKKIEKKTVDSITFFFLASTNDNNKKKKNFFFFFGISEFFKLNLNFESKTKKMKKPSSSEKEKTKPCFFFHANKKHTKAFNFFQQKE